MKPLSMFGLNLNNPTSIQEFTERIASNGNEFGKYLVAKMGYNWPF
jgi:hypothetical protein